MFVNVLVCDVVYSNNKKRFKMRTYELGSPVAIQMCVYAIIISLLVSVYILCKYLDTQSLYKSINGNTI